ncbi:MAG: AAA family ATPase [Microcoleus vaginatus WJT46-NPBG5]|jgi:predicted ATPase/signal transduction histidine kinase|nr:AAA family ATPase [Microcoleus vaginatus WJT46-NPBG5]
MLTLCDYQILAQVHESEKSIVYRALHSQDNLPVILKVLKEDFPSPEQIARYKQEYKIIQNLNLEGVVKVYGLQKYRNTVALVLEDFGAKSLKNLINENHLNLKDILKISIKVVEILGEIHQQNIIHKDINPSNIVVNPDTLQIKLIDFGISTVLSTEASLQKNPRFLEGTLTYMSPEQTGRMNRALDYRTDFYSFGVTLYEMLTRQLFCNTTDAMELVHCQIAKQPVPPHELNSKVPKALSDIVMKLLAKTAEDRYQNAWAIKADLGFCLTQLETNRVIENFIPGTHDVSGKFQIPQKLYGREQEIETLLAAFTRVVSGQKKGAIESTRQGTSEIMLVSGYSGIGKSSLVREIYKPLTWHRGYFILGKFDQFQRNIPYSAIVESFQSLVQQLLTESEAQLNRWREKLLAALGSNGQIIIDVIPEVELIIGKQPVVRELGPAESQNRFNLVFQNFIRVFCQPEHPLVIFLDDLQWADSATLKLIELIMAEVNPQYLFLIGAYRNNEVCPTHSLIITLDSLRQQGVIINEIILNPLNIEQIQKLIAETLYPSKADVTSLAKLVFSKTSGNPFFVNEFLKTLHQEKLLNFNSVNLFWQWDISQIEEVGITDNVVDLMIDKLKKLPEQTQQVLRLAACAGNQFDLNTLSLIYQKFATETFPDLLPALHSGLILPTSELESTTDDLFNCHLLVFNYKFLHDRVQQAAYSLISTEQKKAVHWQIGRQLLKNTLPHELEDRIFEIVEHLNLGIELVTSQHEKHEIAKLNLIAGQKAKAATAYEAAATQFRIALEMLTENSWLSHYELTFLLYLEAAEAEYLNTNFGQAAILAEVVLHQAKNLLDTVKICELQMQVYIAQLEMLKAVETGLQVLKSLGVHLLTLSSEDSLVVELPEIAELENIPAMTDPHKLAAMRILKLLCTPVFQAKPEIFPQVILTMVNLCIEHGNSALSAFAYGFYGLLLSGMGKLDAGYQAGLIALKLLEQFDAKELKAKVYNLFNANIRSWTEHAKNSVTSFQEGVQSGLETGDIEWGGYCIGNYCSYLFFTEESLDSAVQQQAPYINLAIKIKQQIPIHFSSVWQQLGLNFQGKAADKYVLIGESFDESQMLPRLIEAKTGTVLFVFYVAKTILLYQFKDVEAAIKSAALASEQAGSAFGFIQVAILNFYHSLALLAHYRQASSLEQPEYLAQVEANQKNMKHWAHQAPMNFQHKYDLIEAEKARVLKEIVAAMELYDRAIQGARKQGYIQEEALAYEQAAEFYLELGREEIAQSYMTKAHYCYIRWGAKAKVEDLELRYPHFISRMFATNKTNIQATTITVSGSARSSVAALDLSTVMKASQAISGEIVLDKLLAQLMKILVENAGAQKGFLILVQDNQLLLEASYLSELEQILVRQSMPMEACHYLPSTVIKYVERTRSDVVLANAACEGKFITDPYIVLNQLKSVLCVPILNQGKLVGILYLENNLTTGTFTPDRLELLRLLSSQAAISLENAILYARLEEKVKDRTQDLNKKNICLEQTLNELQLTQSQLIQSEKMSSLGQMVAGVAHEINNPINFIYGNLNPAIEYVKNILQVVDLYRQTDASSQPAIVAATENLDFEFAVEDLQKLMNSMKAGAERIRNIVLSLRVFSRLDEADMKPVDIHEGIDSSLMILQHRLRKEGCSSQIEVIKEYGQLPLVTCYAGQLNQVFLYILTNAIDALNELGISCEWLGSTGKTATKQIHIHTETTAGNAVKIRIADNGPGMNEEVSKRIFDPFFTTKPVGSGTGLGLSICYQIVVKKHGGQLTCTSALGQGTELVIEIPINQKHQGV